MARKCMRVYCNGILVRKCGGNKSAIREMAELYKNMTKEQFLFHHPKFRNECKDKFELTVDCY